MTVLGQSEWGCALTGTDGALGQRDAHRVAIFFSFLFGVQKASDRIVNKHILEGY